jgi:hypothetical protein
MVLYICKHRQLQIGFSVDNSTEGRIVVPLKTFGHSGTISWSQIQRFEIKIDNLGIADGSTLYVDGMFFTTAETPNETKYDFDYYTQAWYSLTSILEKRVVENGKIYTSIWDGVVVGTGQTKEYRIENEAVTHAIIPLALAYNYTKSSLILRKLNAYGNWLYRMYSANPQYGGTLRWYDNETQTWADEKQTNGWMLQAASILYGVTKNTTYLTLAKEIKRLVADVIWNRTTNYFDKSIQVSTGTKTYTTSWILMRQAAGLGGLGAYVYFVEPDNSTLKTMIRKAYDANPTAALLTYNVWVFGSNPDIETTAYWHWALYWAWKATGNSTYIDNCIPEVLLLAHTSTGDDGRMPYRPYFFRKIEDDEKWDNWGAAACALLVAYKLVQSPNIVYQRAFEKLMFNHFKNDMNTTTWIPPRRPNSGNIFETEAWSGQLSFYLGAYVLYLHQINPPSTPYVLVSDGNVTTQAYTNNKLTLVIDTPTETTSTTEICTATKGKPTSVEGATSWSYDTNTKILSVTAQHSGPKTIIVRWGEGGVPSGAWPRVSPVPEKFYAR